MTEKSMLQISGLLNLPNKLCKGIIQINTFIVFPF